MCICKQDAIIPDYMSSSFTFHKNHSLPTDNNMSLEHSSLPPEMAPEHPPLPSETSPEHPSLPSEMSPEHPSLPHDMIPEHSSLPYEMFQERNSSPEGTSSETIFHKKRKLKGDRSNWARNKCKHQREFGEAYKSA